MDFLDPRKRRTHAIRLAIGYVLVTIAIGLAAVILLYGAYGYGINTKNGEIVQNGLLFTDSKPGGAAIYLNGRSRNSTTAARLVLPSGNYTLTLKKDGYRDWQRSFTLTEHAIERFVYPFLFPQKPRISKLKTYQSQPALITQSPDQRWLLAQVPASDRLVFDEYDTTNLTKPPVSVALPGSITPGGTFSLVEWASDNKNILLQHDYNGNREFIIFNRDKPAESINVNKTLSLQPSLVNLRNKKISQLYIYDSDQSTLSLTDVSKAKTTLLLRHVLAFKPNGNNLISYVSGEGAHSGQVVAKVWESGKSYTLATFKQGRTYLLDEAQFQSHWYYVVGSDMDPLVNIYKDPLDTIKKPAKNKATPLLSLNIIGANKVSFSNNTRFIEAEAGQTLSVYDFEEKDYYHYSLNQPLATTLHWMDGHRLIGNSNSQFFVTDFDASNQISFTASNYPAGGFFDRNYNHLMTTTVDSSGHVVLNNVDMRAGKDLPANKQ